MGYEDFNNRDQLRHDPLMALLPEKGHRNDSTLLAGKSTLNRLEHAPTEGSDRYHKIDKAAEEMAASAGAGMIDDFRLRGSSTCHHLNAY